MALHRGLIYRGRSVDYLVGQNDPGPDIARTDPATGRVVYCVNASGADTCANGQAAFWYSQDCFVGCVRRATTAAGACRPTCAGSASTRRSTTRGSAPSTACAARAGSAADIDRHNPWRAPGAAPVADACGLAGGTPWGADAPEEGKYANTSFARHGDRGSVALGPLPRRPRVAARGPQHDPYGP